MEEVKLDVIAEEQSLEVGSGLRSIDLLGVHSAHDGRHRLGGSRQSFQEASDEPLNHANSAGTSNMIFVRIRNFLAD
jgi:hypothetical protein